MVRQPLANVVRRHPDNCILPRIVVRVPREDLDADGSLFEAVLIPGQRVFHQIAKQKLAPPAVAEVLALQDTFQLFERAPPEVLRNGHTGPSRLFHPQLRISPQIRPPEHQKSTTVTVCRVLCVRNFFNVRHFRMTLRVV